MRLFFAFGFPNCRQNAGPKDCELKKEPERQKTRKMFWYPADRDDAKSRRSGFAAGNAYQLRMMRWRDLEKNIVAGCSFARAPQLLRDE